MKDNEKDIIDGEEGYFMTLTDEATGEDREFEMYASANIDGADYYALVPVEDGDDDLVLLRGRKEGEDIFFETIDDDDEFDKVEDYFNDLLFGSVDYDED